MRGFLRSKPVVMLVSVKVEPAKLVEFTTVIKANAQASV